MRRRAVKEQKNLSVKVAENVNEDKINGSKADDAKAAVPAKRGRKKADKTLQSSEPSKDVVGDLSETISNGNLDRDVSENNTENKSIEDGSVTGMASKKDKEDGTESDKINDSKADDDKAAVRSKRGRKKADKTLQNSKPSKGVVGDLSDTISNGNLDRDVSENNTENKSIGDGSVTGMASKKDKEDGTESDKIKDSKADDDKAAVRSKRGRKKADKTLQNSESFKDVAGDRNVLENNTANKIIGDSVTDMASKKDKEDGTESDKISGSKANNDKAAVSTKRGRKKADKHILNDESVKDIAVYHSETILKNEVDDDFVTDRKKVSRKKGKDEHNIDLVKNIDIKNSVNSNENSVVAETGKSDKSAIGSRKRNNKNVNVLEDAELMMKRTKFSEKNFHEHQDDESVVAKEPQLGLEQHVADSDIENALDEQNSLKNGKRKAPKRKEKTTTKRKREEKDEGKSDAKSARGTKSGTSKDSSKKEKIPDVSSMDFSNECKSASGKLWNFKIASWNVNGIRAWLEKNGVSYLHHEKPDIMCVQETKCSDDKLPDEVKNIEGYHCYWLSGDKDGYSGVGLISKEKPLNVEYGIGIPEHDNEGRVVTAEYDQFYLVAAYVPNAGRGLVRLEYRMKWDKDFCTYLKKLDEKKPVILCGDLNVAHEEIDLANPKTNKRNAGFTKEEREGFSTLLAEGFIDTFRYLYPDVKDAYTFWTYMMNARAKNVGWRLDYFVMSERFHDNLCDNVIRKDVFGSDHCPITLFLCI